MARGRQVCRLAHVCKAATSHCCKHWRCHLQGRSSSHLGLCTALPANCGDVLRRPSLFLLPAFLEEALTSFSTLAETDPSSQHLRDRGFPCSCCVSAGVPHFYMPPNCPLSYLPSHPSSKRLVAIRAQAGRDLPTCSVLQAIAAIPHSNCAFYLASFAMLLLYRCIALA